MCKTKRSNGNIVCHSLNHLYSNELSLTHNEKYSSANEKEVSINGNQDGANQFGSEEILDQSNNDAGVSCDDNISNDGKDKSKMSIIV